MPDMQTEVKKIIDSWSLPEVAQETAPVAHKPFPERIFEFIQANPRCTLKKIRDAMMDGTKDDSALTNALKNLYDRQLIGRVLVDNPDFKGTGRRLVFVYWSVTDFYTSRTPKKRGRPKNKITKVVAKKKASGIESLVRQSAQPTPKAVVAVERSHTTPEIQRIINNLTVYGAKELWKELNEVFGK